MKVTAALAVMGAVAAKVVAALTVSVLVPAVPMTVLPNELNMLVLLTVTAALAVTAAFVVMAAAETMVAVGAKVVAALTMRVWLPEVPSTVLPATLRVEVEVVRETPPVKVARPVLSMVRRSTGCPLLLLVLPAVVVLNTKLPPVFPVVSCMATCIHCQSCLQCCQLTFAH